ncbi:MAG: pyruvate dehydrogenase (acetyl-transferring) E1 component subunit alpha [Anaerolineae bacterium]
MVTTALHATTDEMIHVSREQALGWFEQMELIRRFEEYAEQAYTQGKIGGFLHLYIGEEAIAVGTIAALQPDDDIVTHYRDHGYALARGLDPNKVMAELYGKATGVSKGKGGSMHLADVRKHFWGGYAIVGGHIPLATGIALAHQYKNEPQIAVCVFGEGSTNIGMFHEALNMAAVWKLPALFIVENNRYGMGTAVARASAVTNISEKAAAYNMPAVQIDGNDVQLVYDTVRDMADQTRNGGGPRFIEMMTYRTRGHSMGDPQRYRTKSEVEEWKPRGPIERWHKRLVESGMTNDQETQQIVDRIEGICQAAVQFAEESPFPDPADLYTDIMVAE